MAQGKYTKKYYDPVKAHEYYMKHRQLKGKKKSTKSKKTGTTSTTGLNAEGKAQAEFEKQKLNLQKKEIIKQRKEELKNTLADIKARFESMTPEEKASLGTSLEDALLNVQAKFEVAKSQLNDEFKQKLVGKLDELKNNKDYKE